MTNQINIESFKELVGSMYSLNTMKLRIECEIKISNMKQLLFDMDFDIDTLEQIEDEAGY